MNRRTFGILTGIAVALALLAILGQNRNSAGNIAGASAGELLLPALATDIEAVTAITVTGAGNEPLVRLDRSGNGWTVAGQDGYAADAGRVNGLLIALAEARIVEEKTANPDFHARLGVESMDTPDAAGLEIALVGDDGGRDVVILGDAYTGGQRYARLADSNLSVLIDRNPDVGRNPSDWVDPAIIDIAGDRVQRVAITHADGERVVLRKDARGEANFLVEDIPDGRELQYASIANVTGTALAGLELDEVAADATGRSPVATIEVSTFDGLVVTIEATAADDEDPWLSFRARFDADQALAFATAPVDDVNTETPPGSDAVAEAATINERLDGWRFRIPAYKYSQLTRRMEDLLQSPPAADE